MFKHILVTTDGSPLGGLALPHAADLARQYGATLSLLYVVPPPQLGVFAEGAAYVYDYPEERERLIEEGARLLDEARRDIDFPEARVVCRETDGRPVAEVIADEVGRSGADLVVMSTHGRGGLAHLLLGSVAEAVLKRVHVPVLLVRGPGEVAKGRPTRQSQARS
ncbi:universal stress protein [Deinococcus planocerae]|uniref:universal stress protein n=1 Tax=Deinococcus planocerae TaxID=1737569 RepID=UPI000C7ECA7A|nr:universal stress protein [Deinococcus planocerae]